VFIFLSPWPEAEFGARTIAATSPLLVTRGYLLVHLKTSNDACEDTDHDDAEEFVVQTAGDTMHIQELLSADSQGLN